MYGSNWVVFHLGEVLRIAFLAVLVASTHVLLIFRFCKQENWIILKSTWYVYMCLFYVLIIYGKFPWIVFIKKKVETNVKSHLNQLILTIVTINQFRLLLNIYFCCLFHLHWSNMFILYMGYQYLLNFFL